MAFQITEILDAQSENMIAKVLHQDNQVTATIRGRNEHGLAVGTSFPAEISFDEILEWKVVNEFEDSQSGLWQGLDGIHLLGRIHTILDYGDGRNFIDVYIQNGPGFFTVNLDATEDETPDANDGLEVIVSNLVLFPGS